MLDDVTLAYVSYPTAERAEKRQERDPQVEPGHAQVLFEILCDWNSEYGEVFCC